MEKNTKAKSQRRQSLENQRRQSQERKSFTSYCEANSISQPHTLVEFCKVYMDYCKLRKI